MKLVTKDLIAARMLLNGGRTVCFVGGGGKTTLMYALAMHRAKMGQRVLVSTTTHIYMPPRFYAAEESSVHALWVQGQIAIIGTPEKEKLTAPEPSLLANLRNQTDVLFLEADGAKGHPCKVPAAHEPVIDPECDLVVAVFGMSAIGRPLREVCFRAEQAMALLGVDAGHILTPADAAKILISPLGGKKGIGACNWCAVLNQCDDGVRRKYAEAVTQQLESMGETNVVMTTFSKEERAAWSRI